jgi:hypothetical protein
MVDTQAGINSVIGAGRTIGFQLIGVVAWVAIVIIVGAIVAVGTWTWLRKKKFNNRLVIMEKINGIWQITKRDVAAELKYTNDGTTIFFAKKHKKTLPKPIIQIGNRTFLYKIREDGEWENVGFSDEKTESKTLEFYTMHNDMRLARASLQKKMEKRYEKKPSWLAENWTWIAGISFVMVLAVSVFLLFDKWIELATTTNMGVETAAKVMDKADQLLSRIETTCAGGKGYFSVPQT